MKGKRVIVVFHEDFITKGHLFSKLEKKLAKDIEERLEKERVKGKVERERGRIFVFPESLEDLEKVGGILKRIFGIKKIGYAYLFDSYEDLLSFLDEGSKLPPKKYKVEVSRANKKFPKTSPEITKEVVDLLKGKLNLVIKGWDEILRIEIRKDKFLLIYGEEQGLGGFPVFEDKALVLFSGGFDSTLASFLARRQGLNLEFLLFVFREEDSIYAKSVLKKLEELYFIRGKLIVEKIPPLIFSIKESLRQLALKRFFYKKGEEIAFKRNAKALITGEVVGQTHTQRLSSLLFLEKDITLPILRPLSFFSKEQIISEIRKLSLYKECSSIPELCVVSRRVNPYPSQYALEELDKEVEKLLTYKLSQHKASQELVEKDGGKELEKEGEVILNLEDKEVLRKVLNYELEKGKKYVLKCKSGIAARFLAEELRKKGFDAVGEKL